MAERFYRQTDEAWAEEQRRGSLHVVVTRSRGHWQLALEQRNSDGLPICGYRLAGPSFDGTSRVIFDHALSAEDLKELRSMIAAASPHA